MAHSLLAVLGISALLLPAAIALGQNSLVTRWAKDVRPERPRPEYPRPSLVRKAWKNLNGPWELAIQAQGTRKPDSYSETITVPFPVEAKLSGIGRMVPDGATVWYRKSVKIASGKRWMLHFGAVDWQAQVWVNGHDLGIHRGGFDPFSFEITPFLKKGEQEIVVAVQDPTDAGGQPRGKQVRKPGGIFYTPCTGIWQTVWLEPLPEHSIDKLEMTADRKTGKVRFQVKTNAPTSAMIEATVIQAGQVVATETKPVSANLSLTVPSPQAWTPESPILYDVRVRLLDGKGAPVDQVESYFAFRDVEVSKDERGITRIKLNGKPTFLIGPLDQGYWPDGIFTAPTDRAMKFDLVATKNLGFNFIRKHVKVEPETWYAACDRMGILVFQDMPAGDNRTDADKVQHEVEHRAMIAAREFHPCIVGWVVFNEGWGQFDTERMTDLTKKLDPSRLAVNASGWTDKGVGDLLDWHVYPGPASPEPEATRAAFLGEFGGLGLPVPGHMWQKEAWGYQSFKNAKELGDRFAGIFEGLRLLQGDPGLSGAVYTQTTDVETEANGLLTYDREVLKVNAKKVRALTKALLLPPPVIELVVPTSEKSPQTWSYSETAPPENWANPSFDCSDWMTGPGGFGTKGTPGAIVGTKWDSSDLWIRRDFVTTKASAKLTLRIHHDEDVTVYLDGRQVHHTSGYQTGYRYAALMGVHLSPGKHTLAAHVRNTNGGQYLDLGLAEIIEK